MKKLLRSAGPDDAAIRGDVLFQDRKRIGGSPMMPLRSAVVGFCLALFAVTGTSALSAEWQDISPKDAYLVFPADELGMELKWMRSRTDHGTSSEYEMGYWKAPNRGVPFLFLHLQRLYSYASGFVEGAVPMRSIIAKNEFFQKQGVEYGKKGSVDNVSGTAKYETYRSGLLHCFLIKEFAGFGYEATFPHNKVVVGYYCDATPTGNSDDMVRAVLSRIQIK